MKTLKIATACFVNEHQELLLVRKQNASVWMLPGGKIENQETPSDAVLREVWEELQITLLAESLTRLGSFDTAAANEADTLVHATAFIAKLPSNQTPKVSAEITELRWLSLHQPLVIKLTPLLKNHIIPALQAL